MNIFKAALAALCLSASSAAAVPIGWSFGVSSGGGNVSGSFVYDADTSMFSDIDILATPTGESAVSVNNFFPSPLPSIPVFWSAPTPAVGEIWVEFDLNEPLTNAGGTVLATISAVRCTTITFPSIITGCGGGTGVGGNNALLTSFVPPAAVPVPPAGVLLLSGIAAMGCGAARRRKSTGAQASA